MTGWWLIDTREHAPHRLTAGRAAEIVVARRGRVRFRFVFLGKYDEAVEAAIRIGGR